MRSLGERCSNCLNRQATQAIIDQAFSRNLMSNLVRMLLACVAGGMRERASGGAAILARIPSQAKPARNSRAVEPRVKFPPATFGMVFACRPLLALLMNQLKKPIRERSI